MKERSHLILDTNELLYLHTSSHQVVNISRILSNVLYEIPICVVERPHGSILNSLLVLELKELLSLLKPVLHSHSLIVIQVHAIDSLNQRPVNRSNRVNGLKITHAIQGILFGTCIIQRVDIIRI